MSDQTPNDAASTEPTPEPAPEFTPEPAPPAEWPAPVDAAPAEPAAWAAPVDAAPAEPAAWPAPVEPAAPAVPPVAPPTYPAGGYPPPTYPATTYPAAAPAPAYPAAPPTSSNAIIALILAIVSWAVCPIVPAIVALILASSAAKEIEASGGRTQGAGLVTAARIVSWVNIGLWAAILVVGLFMFVLLAVAGGVN